MSIAELSFLLWLALTFQWEFNCKGSLNIAGVLEKLDFVCASDAMVSKTDILDPFWHVSIKHVVFAKATFYPSWFYRPAHQFKHSDITFIEECQNDQVYQFSYHGGLDDRHLMHVIINNWFIRLRAFIEIWSTREVWRARKMRKSCSRRSWEQL